MQKRIKILGLSVMLLAILLLSAGTAASQVGPDALQNCKELAFSTEEDFMSGGPNGLYISDGDLLGIIGGATGAPQCEICARNADLTQAFDVNPQHDLGLDAVDVIDVERYVVAFSTELDSPNQGQFTAGDLLVTMGPGPTPPPPVIIRNQALTFAFGQGAVRYDVGLDAVHFVGDLETILAFLAEAQRLTPVTADELPGLFEAFAIDILFSTEGTWWLPDTPVRFLDGDLLRARDGIVVHSNADLLHPDVPAGIPERGVDFGLDAVTSDRQGAKDRMHFSTEILFDGRISFTDGDVLKLGDGVAAKNYDLVGCFRPEARDLGLDALSVYVPPTPVCTSRITKIGGVDVADISLADGTVFPLALDGIDAPLPFGGRIDFQGTICEDVTAFRVNYRKAGSADPWTPIEVLPSDNWRVKVDAFIPWGPDCDAKALWASGLDGWYDGSDYRHLSEAALGGCNKDLSLTVWKSTSAVAGKEELYEVVLETETAMGIVSDTPRLVQLDNTPPIVHLEKTPGLCDAYTLADMPLMVTARISDTHFYEYELSISGDSYLMPHYYPRVRYYDDPFDNIIETGTEFWDSFVPLHGVDVRDVDPDPVKCGYTVDLTAWDRTIACGFSFPGNFASRCVGCRHSGDTWTFEFTP